MFASFDNTGRLFVCESNGETYSTDEHLKLKPFHIKMLVDRDEDGIYESSTVFADSLTYPKGAVFYQGSLYVTSAPELLKLTDTDGDGVADQREVILSGWTLNANAATLGGPFLGRDGWLYLTDARRGFNITTREGKQLTGKGARIWRCRPDGSDLEWLSGGGFDNTVELVFMPTGEAIGTMMYFMDPANGFRDALTHWEYGAVYPKPQHVIEDDQLKLTGDLMPVVTKLPRIAHSGLMRYEGVAWGEEYKGNLFSAQFNTGRIIRHIISQEQASFRTSETAFLTSNAEDIHLTDVLEDAEGNMLVVNTGGWFIAGCPLSLVAKKDVTGSIYRIKKSRTRGVNDLWGKKIDWTSLKAGQLVQYLYDSRHVVRARAAEQLIRSGEDAFNSIQGNLLQSKDEELRTVAVFLLYQLKLPQAMEQVRHMLKDSSNAVVTAAAHVLGLEKDQQSASALINLLQSDNAAVKRSAATALGRIGNNTAVPALLQAAANMQDRFVEHAIIYALITLQSPEPLIDALTDKSDHVRRAALIALDQMDGKPLRKEHLTAFLHSTNPLLEEVGIWVASHHKDWSDIVIQYLNKKFQSKDGELASANGLRNLMIQFSSESSMQQFIAQQLNGGSQDSAKFILLLDIMQKAPVKHFPHTWEQQVGNLLLHNETKVRSAAIDLIKSRRIASLSGALRKIISSSREVPAFRLKALSAQLMTVDELGEESFQLLTHFLDTIYDAPLRQQAARVLAQSHPGEKQLLQLAKGHIPDAEAYLLPDLLSVFAAGHTESVGWALLDALRNLNEPLDNLSVSEIEKIMSAYPPTVKAASTSLVQQMKERQQQRLRELESLQTRLNKGDVGEGMRLFFGKATCSGCHAVGGKGGDFGPDLSNIGEIRSRHDILEAILYPGASFAREYETSVIHTKSGSYTGIIKEKSPEVLVVSVGPGSVIRLPGNEVQSIQPGNMSLMPPGLIKQLNIQEISDLMAYLESLPDGLGQIKSH